MIETLRDVLQRAQNAQRAVDAIIGEHEASHEPIGQPRHTGTAPAFSAALREAREAAGLSQSRLAARAGYDHSYVSRLESDSRSPTRDAVLSLAAAMRCDEVETDRLLASAGFLPLDVANLFRPELVLVDAYKTLTDPAVPADVREDMRSAIAMAVRQGERAMGKEVAP